jgi:transposase
MISKLSGHDRKTIRKYLNEGREPVYGPREGCASKLDRYKEFIEKRCMAGVWNAVVLLRELRELGYEGGYTILNDYLQPRRREARVVAVRRFETPPGQQAQVDCGHLGSIETAEGESKLWVFVLTLGHSRAMAAEAATDQKLGTLLRLHGCRRYFIGCLRKSSSDNRSS